MQANKPKKLDIKKQGLAGVKNAVVKANLMGVSEKMNKKGWTDSQGRKGKVYFASCLEGLVEARLAGLDSEILRFVGLRCLQICQQVRC